MNAGRYSNSRRSAPDGPFSDAEARPGQRTVRDESYRKILGVAAWKKLAPEVRARFAVKPSAGRVIRYSGVMHRVELSRMGWVFAQACRLIGTPLAPLRGRDVPMLIELTPDNELQGVAWSRRYDFPGNRLFTVRSTKCHADVGEFVEHIGRGFSMRLKLREKNGGLEFRSVGYYVKLFARNFRMPDWLTPGVTTVTHAPLQGDRFHFSLSVEHPILGVTVYQGGEFTSVG